MMNIVHLIDCMEFMKGVPDKYYELAIVDPPYGIGADKEKYTPQNNTWKGKTKKGYSSKSWDNTIPTKEYFNELFRISKNQIIWGGNYFGLKGGCIFWDKKETMPTYSKGEIAYNSMSNKVDKFEFLWSGYKKQIQEDRIHPTQKPVALYKWLLKNYAKPGDKIFDSHVGSGSIRIACHDMGFDFEGCELDKDYWEAQEERFKSHTMQGDLFAPQEIQQIAVNGNLFKEVE